MPPIPVPIADALMSLWWLATNAILVRAAWRVSLWLFPVDRNSQHLLHVVVLYVAAIVACTTALGASGWLTGPAVLAAGGLVAASSWLLPHLQRQLDSRFTPPGPLPSFWVGFWGILGGALMVRVVGHGLLRFPVDYDSLMYHMPLMDYWIQGRSLYAPNFGAHWFLAASNELLGLWLCTPFSGDFLASLANVPLLIVWTAALFGFGRQLGLSPAWAHLTAFISLVPQTVLQQCDNMSNDMAVSAFLVAGTSYALRYLETGEPAALGMVGSCVGLLLGVKYFAAGYTVALAVATVACSYLARGPRAATRAAGLLGLLGLPLGGYWYVRNAVVTGLPLYPIGADGPSSELGYPGMWRSTIALNGDARLPAYLASALWRVTGPWHLAAVILAPLVLITLAVSAVRDGGCVTVSRLHRTGRLLIGLVLVGSAAVWAITPFSVENQPGTLNHLRWAFTPVRYGLSFLSLSSVGLAWLLSRLTERVGGVLGLPAVTERLGFSVLALFAVWQAGSLVEQVDDPLGFVLGAFDLAAVGLAASWSSRRNPGVAAVALAMLALVIAPVATASLSSRWHAGFARHFDREYSSAIIQRLDEAPDGQRICVLGNQPYPFFGSRRQHRVLNPRFAPRSAYDAERFLREHMITFVAIERTQDDPVDRYRTALEAIKPVSAGIREVEIGGQWRVFQVGTTELPARRALNGAIE